MSMIFNSFALYVLISKRSSIEPDGIKLLHRDYHTMTYHACNSSVAMVTIVRYSIIDQIHPYNSNWIQIQIDS